MPKQLPVKDMHAQLLPPDLFTVFTASSMPPSPSPGSRRCAAPQPTEEAPQGADTDSGLRRNP